MAYNVDFWYISHDACQISTDFTPFIEAEEESIYMKTPDFFKMVEQFTDPDLERKAKAWDSLKELLMKEYPSVVHLADVSNGEGERGEMNKHEEVLEYMDKLDGTNEFSKLLSYLEDE